MTERKLFMFVSPPAIERSKENLVWKGEQWQPAITTDCMCYTFNGGGRSTVLGYGPTGQAIEPALGHVSLQ